jgi:hypothetical protein
MAKIVFFNNLHRGDLLTNKEFVRQVKKELQEIDNQFAFEYLHFNHPKLTKDLDIPKVGDPTDLDKYTPYYQEGDTFYVNTWIGSAWDNFVEHGGINMNSLWHQWQRIFTAINQKFSVNLTLKQEKEFYLPNIDFSKFNISSIDDYLQKNVDAKKILICNGPPMSGQSFLYNMESFINDVAQKNKDVHFICTTKFATNEDNVLFTDDIILDSEIEHKRAPWEDRVNNNCDLQEISYLSENCNAIVGKNSGPFVFCETKNNFMDSNKKFLSYNVNWGIGKPPTETMSNGLDLKCSYKIVPISDTQNLSDQDRIDISTSLEELVKSL